MSEILLLAGDIGGAKSDLVLVNCNTTGEPEFRSVLSTYSMSPTQVGGYKNAATAIREAVRELLAKGGYNPDETTIAAAVLGVAGIDRAEHAVKLQNILSGIIATRLIISNDAMLPLGTLPQATGIAVVAGSGSICMGRNIDGKTARVGGNGPLFDHGSGVWLAVQALNKLESIEDGTTYEELEKQNTPENADLSIQRVVYCTELFGAAATGIENMRKTGAIDIDEAGKTPIDINRFADLHPFLYHRDYKVRQQLLNSLTPTVMRLASDNNYDALLLIRSGAHQLAKQIKAVAKQLDMKTVPLVATGSLLSRQPQYRELLIEQLATLGVQLSGDMSVVNSSVMAAIQMAQELSESTS